MERWRHIFRQSLTLYCSEGPDTTGKFATVLWKGAEESHHMLPDFGLDQDTIYSLMKSTAAPTALCLQTQLP